MLRLRLATVAVGVLALGSAPPTASAAALAAAPANPPVGATAAGCCGDTDSQKGPNACGRFPKGEFDEKALNITSLAGCVAACRRSNCTECNFVSWSASHEKDPDCSWYRDCDFNNLLHIRGYTSEVVRPAPPPPPPPPATVVTVTAALGAAPTRNVTTVAAIEVDVMPWLGRKSNGKTGGGPHDAAMHWLGLLGADMVRFAPWFPSP